MEGLLGVPRREDGGWGIARGGLEARDLGGAGDADCRRKTGDNGGVRLPEVPPHDALLPVPHRERFPDAERA